MAANSFGSRFVVTTFGESHGPAMGVVIDGCPANIEFNENLIRRELDRRRPGLDAITSARNEDDAFELLSGVFEGKTLGTPITIIVRNKDARPVDYSQLEQNPRVGHADDVWENKFEHSDIRGGGRSSGRETVSRVIAGAIAQMVLKSFGKSYDVTTFAKQIGPITLTEKDTVFDSPSVRDLLLQAKQEGKSYGGVIEVRVNNLDAGLGQPVFHKLKADLAFAYMGVGATIGVEFGDGFSVVNEEGSQWHSSIQQGYGGIRGGISTGEELVARIAFKPTSSVLDVAKKGRHDPCIVPRAIPVIEAMTYLVLVDHMLWSRTDKK